MRQARNVPISAASMARRKARFYAWKAKYSGMTVSKGSVRGWMKDQWQVRQVTTTIA